jgi:hypothetical protein
MHGNLSAEGEALQIYTLMAVATIVLHNVPLPFL